MNEITNITIKRIVNGQEESYQHIDLLINEFIKDPLYSFLEKAGHGNLIITDKMRTELYIGRTYSVEQTAEITDSDAISIRNLLNGANSNLMPHYLQCEKEKKFWHIPTQTVFKIRLVFLFKDKFKSYSWNQIASIGMGEAQPIVGDIMNPAEQRALLEKQITLLQERNKILEKTVDYITTGELKEDIEKHVLGLIEDITKKNESLLEDKNNYIKESESLLEKKYSEINERMEKRYSDMKYNLNRKKAEAEWMEKWLSERSFMDRLLNKNPNETDKKVGIELLLKKYEEEETPEKIITEK